MAGGIASMVTTVQDYMVWDALWAAGVIVGSVLFSYTFGKYAMVPFVAALGLGGVIAAFAPFVDHVPYLAQFAEHEERILGFFIVAVIAFFVFRKNRFFEPCIVPSGWELAVLGVILGGFMLAVLASFLPADMVLGMTPNVRIIFVDDFPRMLWLISPLLALAVLRGGVD